MLALQSDLRQKKSSQEIASNVGPHGINEREISTEEISEVSDDIDLQLDLEQKAKSTVQSVIHMAPRESNQTINSQSDISEIKDKLDILISKMNISKEEEKLGPPTETSVALKSVQEAKCLLDIAGTGFNYYPGEFDGGIIRCEVCFEAACDQNTAQRSQVLANAERAKFQAAGNTFATGVLVDKSKAEDLISGKNQAWYNLKRMMQDHVGCSTTRNGGMAHYKTLLLQKQQRTVERNLQQVMANQLSAVLMVVKVKAASLHYENMVGLLHSCGAEVGNIGHGRNQLNAMIKCFQVYLSNKTKEVLTSPIPSTGLPPHFSTTSDKSTPAHLSNHAVMVLLMVNGEKTAIPIDSPAVYAFKTESVEGGTASELAEQVIKSLTETVKLPHSCLSYLMAHHADGQYQAADFLKTLKSQINTIADGADTFFIVPWDTAHWMDCGMRDIREKEDRGEILRRLVKRANKFHLMFGRGKGYAEYHGFAKENELKANVANTYATTRFTSSAFSQFKSIYQSFEALARAFTEIRETNDECEEMKYLVKGRDFCVDLCGAIDIMSPVMEMMVKSQSLDQYLWSVTKWWPRIKQKLEAMRINIEQQLENVDQPSLQSKLFPILAEHYKELSSEDGNDCTFRNVMLNEGWMVENTNDIEVSKSKKKRTVTWTCRLVPDSLQEMLQFIEAIVDNIDHRYEDNATEAACTLSCFHLPDILSTIQGNWEFKLIFSIVLLQF